MELGLAGKVAVISGGGRGIGAAIGRALAREGVDLLLTGRDPAALETVAADLAAQAGVQVAVAVGDLTENGMAERVIDQAMTRFGRIDILVNNAGATKRGHFLDLSDADWMDGFGLKFHGYVRMARAAWPHLKDGRGTVINIAGVGARAGSREFTIGGAVNAALLNFTKALADLGMQDGVRVNAINPGRIQTDRLVRNFKRLAADQHISEEQAAANLLASCGINRFGMPEEIGHLAAFLA